MKTPLWPLLGILCIFAPCQCTIACFNSMLYKLRKSVSKNLTMTCCRHACVSRSLQKNWNCLLIKAINVYLTIFHDVSVGKVKATHLAKVDCPSKIELSCETFTPKGTKMSSREADVCWFFPFVGDPQLLVGNNIYVSIKPTLPSNIFSSLRSSL